MKIQPSEKQIQSAITVIATLLVFAYLGHARFSANRPERSAPVVDSGCVDRLVTETNGKISTEELQRRCVR